MSKPRTGTEAIRERYKRPENETGWRGAWSNMMMIAWILLKVSIIYVLTWMFFFAEWPSA